MRIRRLLACLVAVTVVAGCGGGGKSASTVPGSGSPLKPNATAKLTIKYPAGLVRAAKRPKPAQRARHGTRRRGASLLRRPQFVDPTSGSLLVIQTQPYSTGVTTTTCVAAAPDPTTGQQTVTAPVYSGGGWLNIIEYQGGDPTTCNTTGPFLAETAGYNYGYGPAAPSGTWIAYSSFDAGEPSVDLGSLLPSGALTLQPWLGTVIYDVDQSGDDWGWYVATFDGDDDLYDVLCTSGAVVLTFAGADGNGVAAGVVAYTGASPAPTAANPANGDFPAPSISNVQTDVNVPVAWVHGGAISVFAGSSETATMSFTVTATDIFGEVISGTEIADCEDD